MTNSQNILIPMCFEIFSTFSSLLDSAGFCFLSKKTFCHVNTQSSSETAGGYHPQCRQKEAISQSFLAWKESRIQVSPEYNLQSATREFTVFCYSFKSTITAQRASSFFFPTTERHSIICLIIVRLHALMSFIFLKIVETLRKQQPNSPQRKIIHNPTIHTQIF